MARAESIAPKAERRSELDLLGMAVVLGLVFFHALQIFSVGEFPVKNEPQSFLATALIAFAALWGMPLMMLIAGMAIWFSLRRRTAAEFVRNRVGRLLVPFVVSLPLLVPPQVYFGLLGDPAYQETYLHCFPRFFEVRFDAPLWVRPATQIATQLQMTSRDQMDRTGRRLSVSPAGDD